MGLSILRVTLLLRSTKEMFPSVWTTHKTVLPYLMSKLNAFIIFESLVLVLVWIWVLFQLFVLKANQFIFTLRIQSTAKTEERGDFWRHVNPYWLSKPRFVLFVRSNHNNLVLHFCLETYTDTVFKGKDYSWLVQS